MNTASKRAAAKTASPAEKTIKPLKGGEELFEEMQPVEPIEPEPAGEELAPALEFANESFSSYEFMKWEIGEEIVCRLAGMLCHPDDTARHPDLKYTESENCINDDNNEFKQYYMLEVLDEKFKPTGAYKASNTYWGLEQFFTDKISQMGADLTGYVLKIALTAEIERKGKKASLKVFNILKATTASLPIVQK